MKKSLVVLFVLVSLVVVGCGKGASGFDKPEDLGKKLVTMKKSFEDGDFTSFLTLVHFSKAENKTKAEAYFNVLNDYAEKMKKFKNEEAPKEDTPFTFKEAKVEGDNGELLFSDESSMKIIKVENKWFISETESMIQGAISANLEEFKKQMEDGLKRMEESAKNAPKGE